MARDRDLSAAVERAERELRRCCVRLADRFEPGILRGRRLDVRIDGWKPRGNRLEEMSPPMVRLPAAALTAPPEEFAAALLHAMVHWVNAQQGLADCNHAGYHNRRFRDLARAVGFAVGDRQPRFGWTDLRPTPELAASLADLRIHPQRLAPLAAALPPAALARPPRCKPNLPIGLAASPYWRSAETVVPRLPRYRLQLLHEAQQPIEIYP